MYREYRCEKCNKLLFKGLLVISEVEIKCKGCRTMNVICGSQKSGIMCLNENCILSNFCHCAHVSKMENPDLNLEVVKNSAT